MTQERRRLQRFELDIPAHVFARNAAPNVERVIHSHTRDISANGAFIYVDQAPGLGTRVRVDLELVIDSLPVLLNVPEKVHISVKGRVVRHTDEGVGILFDAQLKFKQPHPMGEVKN